MSRHWLIALGWIAAVTVGASAQGEVESGAGLAAAAQQLQRMVISGYKAGSKPNIYLDIAGRTMRVKLVGADADSITISAMGSQMPVAWKDIPAARLAPMAGKFARTGGDHLLIARFYALNKMRERAAQSCRTAQELDPKLGEKVRETLALLPKPEAPKKPVWIMASSNKPKTPKPPRNANHDGRVPPPMPEIARPVMFNTPEADRILAAMQIFPKNNPWNEDVSKRPVHADSDAIIANIGADKNIDFNTDMCFVIVPPDQPRVDVKLVSYPRESDKGPYPVPGNAPIEGWPLSGGALDNIQRNGGGDRHVIAVDPIGRKLYEFYVGRMTDSGWQAACEATFDLSSNKLRRRGWTSSDAAGLPIFPAVVRYDECERGRVEHALRFTVRRTRKEYIYPATHHAGRTTDKTVAAMGQRLRLKSSVDISSFPRHAKAVALALKKYGMFVADNGGDWRISSAPDKRLKGLRTLRRLKGRDFEVVETTGAKGYGRR